MVEILQVAATILSIAGVIFLAREVLLAHEAEKRTNDLNELTRIDELYRQGRIREFGVEYYMYQGKSRAEAEAFVADFSDDNIVSAVDMLGYEGLQQDLLVSAERHRNQTLPRVYARRRRGVLIGASLLVLAPIFALAASIAASFHPVCN